jgi:hypothetical protein
MWACIVCRFETELDDVAITRTGGGCTCLGCFDRETGGCRPMPKALRRELSGVLDLV